MQAKWFRWILLVAASAAIHGVLLFFLLDLSFTIASGPAPDIYDVKLKPLYATAQTVNVKALSKPEPADLVTAQPASEPSATAARPAVQSPVTTPGLPEIPAGGVEAERLTIRNPVGPAPPVEGEASLAPMPEETINRPLPMAEVEPSEAEIVSDAARVESIRPNALNATAPREAVPVEAEAAEPRANTTQKRPETSVAIPTPATTIRPTDLETGQMRPALSVAEPTSAAAIGATAVEVDPSRISAKKIAAKLPGSTEAVRPVTQALATTGETVMIQPESVTPADMIERERAAQPQHKAIGTTTEPSAVEQGAVNAEESIVGAVQESLAPEQSMSVDEKMLSTTAPGAPTDSPDIEQMARRSYRSGALKESLAMIETGLRLVPGQYGLLSLRDKIQQALNADEEKHRIAALLQKADQQLVALRLTLPAGDNAYETYKQVLTISSHNRRAQQGMHAIADRYEYLASAKREEGDFQDGLRLVALGLSVDPGHSGLQSLQSEIENTLRAQAERAQRLARLYAQVLRQLKERKLSQPAGDNAYETIQAILRIDPGNARAQQTFDELLTRYKSLVLARERNGDLHESLALVQEALEIKPADAELLALQKTLNAEVEASRPPEIETAPNPPAPPVEAARRPKPPSVKARQPTPRIFGTF